MYRISLLFILLIVAPLQAETPSQTWQRYLSAERIERLVQRFGEPARERLHQLKQFLSHHQHQDLPIATKLSRVNAFFNQLTFVADKQHWQQRDYWATPLEFVASGGGDCEDFAIAKYVGLRVLGVSAEQLRLSYVKALTLDQAHMVLTFFATPDAMPLVLDNLTEQILPGDQRTDLEPVYSFNAVGLWRARAFDQGVRLKQGESGVELWQDLIRRISIEGE